MKPKRSAPLSSVVEKLQSLTVRRTVEIIKCSLLFDAENSLDRQDTL